MSLNEQIKLRNHFGDCLPTPWLMENGARIPDTDLRTISCAWDAETWERFLQATVDKEISRREAICDGYDDLLEGETETLWTRHCDLPQAVQESIDQSVRSLELLPRKVTRGLYWKYLSQSEISRKLKISQPHVHRQKNLSLSRIKDLLELPGITAAYLIGGSANLAPRRRSRNEEISDVYVQDLCGSYIK